MTDNQKLLATLGGISLALLLMRKPKNGKGKSPNPTWLVTVDQGTIHPKGGVAGRLERHFTVNARTMKSAVKQVRDTGIQAEAVHVEKVKNPPSPICIDCGRKISYDKAIPTVFMGKRAYLCQRCTYIGVPAALVPRLNPLDRYRAFHGVPASKTTMVKIPIPEKGDTLCKIGDLERIEYRVTGKSRRKNIRFYHDSGKTLKGTLKDRAVLAASNETGHLFIIPTKAGYPKFRAEGIIG